MSNPLRFQDLDGLGFAAQRGKLDNCTDSLDFSVVELGPFLEYALLAAADILPKPRAAAWLALAGLSRLYQAMRQRQKVWLCPHTRHVGLFRTSETPEPDENAWIAFGLVAQRAAEANGFHCETAAQFAAALGEMYSNIYEHSGAPRTGLVAFKAGNDSFEFVVADWGIGVLQSLRSGSEHVSLTHHGKALELALQNGVSRFGVGSGRGNGFRPIFTGLANLNGNLRFRSGDYALTIEGDGIGRVPWMLAEKVPMKGFFISVSCRSL